MKRSLIIAILLLYVSWMKGQPPGVDPYSDSLQKLIRTTAADTARARLYFLLSDYWSDRDSAKALQFIADYFREGIHDDYYDGLAHFYLGGVYFEYNYLRAQQEYMTADRLLSAYSTPAAVLYRSRTWHNYGVLEQKKDDERSFIDIQLNKAIPMALQAGDTNRVAGNYKEVGQVFMNFEEYDKAREYFRRALILLYRPALHPVLSRPDADRELVADCYIDMAKAYLLNDDTLPARLPLDSAALLLGSLPNSSYQPSRYLVEGMYHAQTGRWQNALDSLDIGEALARGQNRTYDMFSILFEKFDVYRREKKFVEARKILQRVYEFNQIMPLTNNRRLMFHELAETEAALGHDRLAYQWLQDYTRLSDSLAKAGTTVQIAALEARYRSSEKEKEALELNNRSKIQKLLLLGGIILLFIILLFLVYRFRQKKLQAEQQLRSLQQQQRIAVASALLNGEERERQRLARDLHDGLGGMLAGVKIHLSEMAFSNQQEQEDPTLQKVIRQLDNSVRELRHIAHNLMPESLVRSGLEVALNDLCESSGNGSTKVVLQMMNISMDIPKPTQLLLYRIVQELLSNVLKHARASEVLVQCSQSEDIFYITVEDDGAGFDQEMITHRKGIGLDNIRHRVDFLKGRLEIESNPGKGTIINIEINVA